MNINFKKAWTTVFSNIKVTLFSRYDDNSYLNGLSKAVRTVNPNESDSADKLYKAIKASMDQHYKRSLYQALFLCSLVLIPIYLLLHWTH